MVLVKGWLCGEGEGPEGFFSSFSTGSSRNSRLRLIGAVKISACPECKAGKRWIPQNTTAGKVLVLTWESLLPLSPSAQLL